MFQLFVAIVGMSFVGAASAHISLWVLRIREIFGFPEHQVIKHRRLPSDYAARGGYFHSIVGSAIGISCVLVVGVQSLFVVPVVLASVFAGWVISRKRLRVLGESYLKRAHTRIHVQDFAGAIQDANESSRCSRRYVQEAQELVRAAKELRKTAMASAEVQKATAGSDGRQERRRVGRRVH